nr:RNA-dependent RNA polymerase [Sarcosphaera coronaria partitivirus]
MKLPNILQIGFWPSRALRILTRRESPDQITAYNNVVERAIRNHFTEDEFDRIVNQHHMSEWSEQALNHDIDTLDSEFFEVNKDEHYYHAISFIKKRFFTPEKLLQPVHFADLRKYPWELSTNIGAPFATSKHWRRYVNEKYLHLQDPLNHPFTDPTHRDLFAEAHNGQSLEPTMVDARMSKRNLYNEMFYINRWHIHRIKEGHTTTTKSNLDYKFWHTAFARRYPVDNESPDKVRLVFGAPSLGLMAEQMFIWPLQAWLMSQNEKSPMLWGYETLTGGWHRLTNFFTRYYPRFDLTILIDWSKFDKLARHTVIKDIHSQILRPMFNFNDGYHPTIYYPDSSSKGVKPGQEPYSPDRIETLWNWMSNSITDTPLLLPDGRLIKFQHSGIFSGFFQTQILDSLYNMVMIFTILFKLGFTEEQIAIKVQGDDSITLLLCCFKLVASWILEMIAHYALKYFGAILSEKKSSIKQGLEHADVLKYHNSNGLPYRDPIQLMVQLRHPERSTSFPTLKARAIGIAYANCGSDPRVYKVCEEIHQYLDKFVEDVDPRGIPEQIQFIQKYLQQENNFRFDQFPTYMDTVIHLMDKRAPLPSKKYWPLDHFLGLPGYN